MNKGHWIAVAALITISGCAVGRINYALELPEHVARDTVVQDSKFDNQITYGGPAQHVLPDGSFNNKLFPINEFRLRGWRAKGGTIVGHQLYMVVRYSAPWQLYTTASFEGGQTASLVEIDRSVVDCTGRSPCTLREVVGLDLEDQFLREHVGTGFTVRIEGRTPAHTMFTVPPNYIQGYLNVVGPP